MEKKTQVRFADEHDVFLLREVLATNPFSGRGKGWVEIAAKVSQTTDLNITARCARERTDLLLRKFKRDDGAALKRSGEEEEVSEKTVLLQEISEMVEEGKEERKKATVVKEEEDGRAEVIRKRAMDGMAKDGATGVKRRCNMVTFLKEKSEREHSLRDRELNIKERELALQSERLAMEREERQAAIKAQASQTTLLLNLIDKISK